MIGRYCGRAAAAVRTSHSARSRQRSSKARGYTLTCTPRIKQATSSDCLRLELHARMSLTVLRMPITSSSPILRAIGSALFKPAETSPGGRLTRAMRRRRFTSPKLPLPGRRFRPPIQPNGALGAVAVRGYSIERDSARSARGPAPEARSAGELRRKRPRCRRRARCCGVCGPARRAGRGSEWQGSPVAVRLVEALRLASGERCALATGSACRRVGTRL